MISIFKADNLQVDSIRHGFFGRGGGVSSGIYKSLNVGMGSDDDEGLVIKNRELAAAELDIDASKLINLYQIHSANVVTVDKPWNIGEGPKADGMVTNIKGIALGILTADCVPVLFADTKASVIGAAHAGWQGALTGVLSNTINAMEDLGANRDNIRAAIGPAISQASYEVDTIFYQRFLGDNDTNHQFFKRGREGHFQFDLKGYVSVALADELIESVSDISLDTYKDEENFFSYRRATHKKEADYGRQLSAICLV